MARKVTGLDPGWIVNTQRIVGNNSAYVALTSAQLQSAPGVPLQLSYTPSEDVWWETYLMVGLIPKMDAAYHYADIYLSLTPSDVGGSNAAYARMTQYLNGPLYYGWREIKRMWQLAGGTAYTCGAYCTLQGGTWQYYQGANYLQMESVAWTR